MASDFANLNECKLALQITDDTMNAELQGHMRAATDALIDYMSRDPRVSDYDETYNGLGTNTLCLRAYPILSVQLVTVTSAGSQVGILPVIVGSDQFTFDDYSIVRNWPFPRGHRNVRVVYTAGIDPAPKQLKQAYLYTVRAFWTARQVNLNATGESWAGVNSEAWKPAGPGTIPDSAKTLVQSMVQQSIVP